MSGVKKIEERVRASLDCKWAPIRVHPSQARTLGKLDQSWIRSPGSFFSECITAGFFCCLFFLCVCHGHDGMIIIFFFALVKS